MHAAKPVLFPHPRHIEYDGCGACIDMEAAETRTTGLPAQGFELEITSDQVLIRYADEPGRRYAHAALHQIRQQSDQRLPAVQIRDWPDFAVRGYMLDISRDRVPTRRTLERLVDLMSLARINHFQLYTEHTFAYRHHEVVWRDASPIIPEDVRWLDKLCHDRGIELAANQNCFGHMERWLKHATYRDRAEITNDLEVIPGFSMPPSVLAATPDNATFALELFEELLENFTSNRVNIGCDEVLQLGLGVSRDAVEKDGKAAVFAEHVRRIVGPLVANGYEPLFWDDMVRNDPAVLKSLAGATAISWWYDAPHDAPQLPQTQIAPDVRETLRRQGLAPGQHRIQDFRGFSDVTSPVADAGFPFWVAPGTSSWSSLVGRIDRAQANLLDAAQVGLERGATGYLITDWGDGGHFQPPSISFGPLMFGAGLSWCHHTNRDVDLPALLNRFVFADNTGTLGEVLDDIGRVWRETGYLPTRISPSPLQAGLHPRLLSRLEQVFGGQADPTRIAAVVDRLDSAWARLDHNAATCPDANIIDQELRAAIRLARHGAWRLLDHIGGTAPSNAELRDDIENAIAQQREAWLQRSRPGGLDDSLQWLRESAAALGP